MVEPVEALKWDGLMDVADNVSSFFPLAISSLGVIAIDVELFIRYKIRAPRLNHTCKVNIVFQQQFGDFLIDWGLVFKITGIFHLLHGIVTRILSASTAEFAAQNDDSHAVGLL